MKLNITVRDIFEAFSNKRVLIIGDVVIDSYIYGNVHRISPEAPVPIIDVTKREQRLGGAANVAMNIKSLGAIPILCSVLGDDNNENFVEELMEAQGLSKKALIKSSDRKTTIKHRVISGTQHLLRMDDENTHYLTHEDQKILQKRIDTLLDNCDLVIFEDYDKGVICEEMIHKTIEKANKKNIPTAVDPKKKHFFAYQNATLFKPNFNELKEGLDVSFDATEKNKLSNAVAQLDDLLHAKNYLVTLSNQGVFYKNEKEEGKYNSHLRMISDVSGAGDTVISIAGLALTLNLPISFIAEFANLGGGIVCESPGVVPIDIKKLESEVRKNSILKNYL